MKTNITLKVAADLLRQARVVAAKEGTSVSRLLAERLEEIIRQRKSYDPARRRAVARLRQRFRLKWRRPASRQDLHER